LENTRIVANFIGLNDELQALIHDINQALWDNANDMAHYELRALESYLTRQDTLFVACHDVAENSRTLLGIGSARLEFKPYGCQRWLYVDEVDVCADQRQRGAGKAIMKKLIEYAADTDCEEIWLGTERDNRAANALYRSLDPDEVGQVVGYTYRSR